MKKKEKEIGNHVMPGFERGGKGVKKKTPSRQIGLLALLREI